jgi:hypothetical protein
VTNAFLQYMSWRRRRRRQCCCAVMRGGGNDLFTHPGINRRVSWSGYLRGSKWDGVVLNLKVLTEIMKQQQALVDRVMESDPGNACSPTVDRLRMHLDFNLKLKGNCNQIKFRLLSLNPQFCLASANPPQSTEDLFRLTKNVIICLLHVLFRL